MNKLKKLYDRGMKPVFRDTTMDHFERIPSSVVYKEGTLKWSHRFNSTSPVFFAFVHPYTCQDLEEKLAGIERSNVPFFFHRRSLCRSLEGRPVELVTVTSAGRDNDEASALVDGHGVKKPVLFISARVHPGEVPAQWCADGVLDLVTSLDDPRAIAFREHFVLYLVPMLNPDGVAVGHYRSDTRGENLNRHYDCPTEQDHPSIAAVKSLLRELTAEGDLFAYVDLHAHANKRGCFIYGNSASDDDTQAEVLLLPKLMSLNSPWFDFNACNFTEKNMTAVEKRDGLSKEASGRVICFREFGIAKSYTLECNYNDGPVVNEIADAVDPRARKYGRATRRGQKYGPEEWRDVGESILLACLDLKEANPWSRVAGSMFVTLDAVQEWTKTQINAARDPKAAMVNREEKQWTLCAE